MIREPFGVQFRSKTVLGSNETGFDVVDVLDELSPSVDDGDFDMARAETGTEPIFDVGTEPVFSHFFEDFLDSPFDNLDRVADVVSDEEPKIPSEPIQPKTDQIPQPEEGMRKKRIKATAGRTDLPLV